MKTNGSLFFYHTPIGRIGITENGTVLTHVFFEEDFIPDPDHWERRETDLLRMAATQLQEYFSGRRKVFDVPLSRKGTPFRQKVRGALLEIPYGETRSYREIARAIGMENACRAVGMANKSNPLPIFIPCHRVIGSNGKLIGYAGGLDKKQFLLDLEKQYV